MDAPPLTSTMELQPVPRRVFFTPRRVARMSIFISLSAVGALTKIPSPTGTVALDACPGYFIAAAYGYREGAFVAAIGHLLSALTIGFPLGIPVHLYIATQMALWAMAFRFLTVKIHPVAGIVGGVILNGFGSSYLMVPIGGVGLATALVLPLVIGSFANVMLAGIAYTVVKRSNLLPS
jgi:riboflavin transporter